MKIHKILFYAFAVVAVFASCSDDSSSIVQQPIFTDPTVKLTELSGQDFMQTLLNEAVALEPLTTISGSQMHMGFWSAAGNHGQP